MERPLVLVVGHGRSLEECVGALTDVRAEREPDYARALDALVRGPHDVGLVEDELGGGLLGTDLIREAVSRHCPVPLLLVTSASGREVAALEAGAVGCVDPRSGAAAIGWSVAFARSARLRADDRSARMLKEVSSVLAHEGKNVLAAIGGAVEVLSHGMPPNGPDWAICQEIRARLGAFRDTIDAMTLAARLRAPATRDGGSGLGSGERHLPGAGPAREVRATTPPGPPVPEPARGRRGSRARRSPRPGA